MNENLMPPTLSTDAMVGDIENFGNCRSTLPGGNLSCKASLAKPGGQWMWIHRIEGADVGVDEPEIARATIVGLSRYPLLPGLIDGDPQLAEKVAEWGCDPQSWSYSPACTHESGRLFFAGPPDAARWLLDVFESMASQSENLAKALMEAYPEESGLEAALFEWPQGAVSVLTICNFNRSEATEDAVRDIVESIEERHPELMARMGCKAENSYTHATHDILGDEAFEEGELSDATMMAMYAQDERLRKDFLSWKDGDSHGGSEYGRLESLLERREVERAASLGRKSAAGKARI